MRRHSDRRQDLVIGLDMATWRFMVVLTKWLMLYAWRTPWNRKQTFIHSLLMHYEKIFLYHISGYLYIMLIPRILPLNHVSNLRVEWFFYYKIQMKALIYMSYKKVSNLHKHIFHDFDILMNIAEMDACLWQMRPNYVWTCIACSYFIYKRLT